MLTEFLAFCAADAHIGVAAAAAVQDILRSARAHVIPQSRDSFLAGFGTVCFASGQDLWIYCVNQRPDLFAVKILRGLKGVLPEGLSARSIPLGALAKYKFDSATALAILSVSTCDSPP